MITVTTLGSCMSLLPLPPHPAVTGVPVAFFGMCNRHFVIFCSLVLSSHLHCMGTKHKMNRQVSPETTCIYELKFIHLYKLYNCPYRQKKKLFIPISQSTLQWITKKCFHQINVKLLQCYISHLPQSPFIQYNGDNSYQRKWKKIYQP